MAPIRKLRSLDEAEDACWFEPGPALFRRIAYVWALAARLAPRRFPHGVYKNRTIEEANRRAEAWEQDRVELPNLPVQVGRNTLISPSSPARDPLPG